MPRKVKKIAATPAKSGERRTYRPEIRRLESYLARGQYRKAWAIARQLLRQEKSSSVMFGDVMSRINLIESSLEAALYAQGRLTGSVPRKPDQDGRTLFVAVSGNVETFRQGEPVMIFPKVEHDTQGLPHLIGRHAGEPFDFVPVGVTADDLERISHCADLLSLKSWAFGLNFPGAESSVWTVLKYIPVNPTSEEIIKLAPGGLCVFEGILKSYEEWKVTVPLPRGATRVDTLGRMVLSTEQGSREIGYKWELRIVLGELANIINKRPMLGERLRMGAIIQKDGSLVVSSEQIRLLVAHPSRLAAYNQLRQAIGVGLRQLESYAHRGEVERFRCLFADLRTNELTEAESQKLIDMAQKLPTDERPVIDHSFRQKIQQGWGFNPEQHNKDAFKVFAAEALFGDRVQTGEQPVPLSSILNCLATPPFTPEEAHGLVSKCLRERFMRIANNLGPSRQGDEDRHLVYHCLVMLSRSKLVAAGDDIAWVIDHCIGVGLFRNKNRLNYMLDEAVDSLARLAASCPEVAQHLTHARLQAWHDSLAESNLWKGEVILGKLVAIMRGLVEVEADPD